MFYILTINSFVCWLLTRFALLDDSETSMRPRDVDLGPHAGVYSVQGARPHMEDTYQADVHILHRHRKRFITNAAANVRANSAAGTGKPTSSGEGNATCPAGNIVSPVTSTSSTSSSTSTSSISTDNILLHESSTSDCGLLSSLAAEERGGLLGGAASGGDSDVGLNGDVDNGQDNQDEGEGQGEGASRGRSFREARVNGNVGGYEKTGPAAAAAAAAAVNDQSGRTTTGQQGSSVVSAAQSTTPQRHDLKGGFFAVFDGHGGARAAEFCASQLHELLAQHPLLETDPATALRDSCRQLDQAWLRSAARLGYDDGSTVVAALIVKGVVHIANIGDSRALICGKTGRCTPLTSDHKPNREDEKRRIEALGGRIVYHGTWRVEGILALTRAIGDQRLKRFITAEPEVRSHVISADDHWLVLATDGVWDALNSQDACDLVRTCADGREAALRLARAAYKLGSQDNITALVVDLRPYHNRPATMPAKLLSSMAAVSREQRQQQQNPHLHPHNHVPFQGGRRHQQHHPQASQPGSGSGSGFGFGFGSSTSSSSHRQAAAFGDSSFRRRPAGPADAWF